MFMAASELMGAVRTVRRQARLALAPVSHGYWD
jgi:hypothetical protein